MLRVQGLSTVCGLEEQSRVRRSSLVFLCDSFGEVLGSLAYRGCPFRVYIGLRQP